MYHKKWRRQTAQLRALVESSDSDENPGPSNESDNSGLSFADSPTDIQTQEQSDTGEDEYRDDHHPPDSDGESDSEIETLSEEESSDLRSDLAKWAVKNKATRTSVDELLLVLRKHGHRLPKDARTLLGTPHKIEVRDLCGGQFLYFGVETGLLKTCSQYPDFFSSENEMLLNFSVDGVPLFKSSNVQMWPILCSVKKFEPFIVALFCGTAKPNSVTDYTSSFLTELKALQQHGVEFQNGTINVKVNAFICDAPARAFLKCIKSHNAYSSCERCTIEGHYVSHRVVFNYQSQEKVDARTEDDFIKQAYPIHQTGCSPLIAAGLQCIQPFVLDYMHVVCLGVVRRLLNFLKQGPRECRLSSRQIGEISAKLLSLSGKLPREFARQPRSLTDLDRWKATEFRQFLLYTGPVVLRGILQDNFYHHFLTLSVAMSILLDSNGITRMSSIGYAEELLVYFYRTSTKLYSPIFPSYNVHALIHLSEDARHFKTSLNDISAFQFENHLQKLKKCVRNAKNPIAQLSKRIAEMDNSKIPISPAAHGTFVSTKKKDSCFFLGHSFALVKERRPEKTCVCDVYSLNTLDSFFTSPCDSKLINIAVLRGERGTQKRELIEEKKLKHKAVCLPYKSGYVFMPLLHGIERN